MSTAAILLAAGESRRMGQLKALLPWQGTSLLRHQVNTLLSAGVDQVVVVLGHRADELSPFLEGMQQVTWRINPDYLQGKTTSIKAGLGVLDARSIATILMLNVDQPRNAHTIRSLLDQHRASGGLITIPEYQGKGGHPIFVDASLLEELTNIDEATFGVKAVVRKHREDTTRVPMDHPEVLWDLNTPDQYHEALNSRT